MKTCVCMGCGVWGRGDGIYKIRTNDDGIETANSVFLGSVNNVYKSRRRYSFNYFDFE